MIESVLQDKKGSVGGFGRSSGYRRHRTCTRTFSRFQEHGTVVVRKWITDVRLNAFSGVAKVCRDGEQKDEDIPQRTRKVVGQLLNQVLEDVETRNAITKHILKSTDFLRHVAGETEGRGAITPSHMFVSIVTCSFWKTSSGRCPPTMEKDANRTVRVAGGVLRAGNCMSAGSRHFADSAVWGHGK